MARIISLKIVNASTAKRNGKPLQGVKNLGHDPAILFYEIEDGYKTEESEILVIHNSILVSYKQKMLK